MVASTADDLGGQMKQGNENCVWRLQKVCQRQQLWLSIVQSYMQKKGIRSLPMQFQCLEDKLKLDRLQCSIKDPTNASSQAIHNAPVFAVTPPHQNTVTHPNTQFCKIGSNSSRPDLT
jgi:hypothetical protein